MAECYCNNGYRIVPYTTTTQLDDGSVGNTSTYHEPSGTVTGPGDTIVGTNTIRAITAMWDTGSESNNTLAGYSPADAAFERISQIAFTVTFGTGGGGWYFEVSTDKIHWYDGRYAISYQNGQTQAGGPWATPSINVDGSGNSTYSFATGQGFGFGSSKWRYMRITVFTSAASPSWCRLSDFRIWFYDPADNPSPFTQYVSGGTTSTLTNPSNIGPTIIY